MGPSSRIPPRVCVFDGRGCERLCQIPRGVSVGVGGGGERAVRRRAPLPAATVERAAVGPGSRAKGVPAGRPGPCRLAPARSVPDSPVPVPYGPAARGWHALPHRTAPHCGRVEPRPPSHRTRRVTRRRPAERRTRGGCLRGPGGTDRHGAAAAVARRLRGRGDGLRVPGRSSAPARAGRGEGAPASAAVPPETGRSWPRASGLPCRWPTGRPVRSAGGEDAGAGAGAGRRGARASGGRHGEGGGWPG